MKLSNMKKTPLAGGRGHMGGKSNTGSDANDRRQLGIFLVSPFLLQ